MQPGLNLPWNPVRGLQAAYATARQRLSALRAGESGANDPKVLAQQQIVDDLRSQLYEAVMALRNTSDLVCAAQ